MTNGSRSKMNHDGLRPALKRAKLRKVTIHSLRHTFASALIMDGKPVTQIAHLLGHSSPAITLKVYPHWFCVRSLVQGGEDGCGLKSDTHNLRRSNDGTFERQSFLSNWIT